MICNKVFICFSNAIGTLDSENMLNGLVSTIIFIKLHMSTLEQQSAEPVGKRKNKGKTGQKIFIPVFRGV